VKISKAYLAIRPVAWYKPFTTSQIKDKGIDKIPTGKNMIRSARKTYVIAPIPNGLVSSSRSDSEQAPLHTFSHLIIGAVR
jgi:hypothetical protein